MIGEIGNAISDAIRSSLIICVGVIFVGAVIEFYTFVRNAVLSIFFFVTLAARGVAPLFQRKDKDYDGIDYEDEF